MIYQKEFIVMDCDKFTKRYLSERGKPFGDPLPTPDTFYDPRESERCLYLFSIKLIQIAKS